MSTSKTVAEAVPEVQCSIPAHVPITGRFVKLLPMRADHADQLFITIGGNNNAAFYDYMFYGPYPDIEPFREHIAAFSKSKDTQFCMLKFRDSSPLETVLNCFNDVPRNHIMAETVDQPLVMLSLHDIVFTVVSLLSLDHNFTKETANPKLIDSIQDVRTGALVGQISHLRIDLTHRVIEIGHIMFGSTLRQTVAATEAFYLMARKAFDEGYRRLEWKTDSTNSASRRAAIRFGHTFEGVFRQHMIIKGRNRDSAWFSILDKEWPVRQKALELWMNPNNFDEDGQQRKGLEVLRSEVENNSITQY